MESPETDRDEMRRGFCSLEFLRVTSPAECFKESIQYLSQSSPWNMTERIERSPSIPGTISMDDSLASQAKEAQSHTNVSVVC